MIDLPKVVTVFFIGLMLGVTAPANAQKLPTSTTIGTNPAGTVFYAVSAGLAKVISGAGPMQSVVQPYTGSSTFMPLVDSGELDFGIINAVETNLGYQGPAKLKIGGKNPLPHVPNTRLIMRGSPLSVSLVVKKDSPMKTVHDVKGKRVTGFGNEEETAVQLENVVPFLLEDRLKQRGGIYTKVANWAPHIEVDGLLVTGQNPASSAPGAEALLKLVRS